MTDLAEIEMIRDSARAFVPPGGDFVRIRGLRFGETGFDLAIYRQMAEMGWLMLRLPEEEGGLGLGMRAYCALAAVLGAGLVPEPLIHANLAVRLLGAGAGEAVLAGTRIVLPAWQTGFDGLDLAAGVTGAAGGLSGEKRFVYQAAGADAFLVTGAEGGWLVEVGAEGVSLECEGTQDGGHFGSLRLAGVSAERIDLIDPAAALDEAALATSAYLLGVAETAFEMTLDYLRVRKQFDKPIGSFQSLQHRATDLKMQLALLRAGVDMAAGALDAGVDDARRSALVSQVKVRAADTAMLVAREAVQMHGAIGFTDEHDVGLFVRKAMTLANQFGSAAFHRRRFAAMQPYAAA